MGKPGPAQMALALVAVAAPVVGSVPLLLPGGSGTSESGFARLAVALYAFMTGYLLLVIALVTRLSTLRRYHKRRRTRERVLLGITPVAVVGGLGPAIGLVAMVVRG